MLWFHIPCIIIVYGTSNEPQNDIGNCLGPFSNMVAVVLLGLKAIVAILVRLERVIKYIVARDYLSL